MSSSATIGTYGSVMVEAVTAGSTRLVATVNQDTTVTIKRRDAWRLTPQALAGADGVAVFNGDSLVISDSAPRLGSATYYDVTFRVSATDHTATIDITIPFPAVPDGCYPIVINDPINPGLEAVVSWANVPEITLSSRGATFDVIGREDRVAVGGVRSSQSGQLRVICHTTNQDQALRAILMTGRVVLIRMPEEADPDRTLFYAAIGDAVSGRTIPNVTLPHRTWLLPYVTVAEPDTAMMAKVGNSWQDVLDGNPTWQDLLDRGVT